MFSVNPDSAHVIAPPPAIFVVCFLAGFGLQWLWPLDLFQGLPAVKLIGMILAFASAFLALWGFITLRRAGTNVDPSHPTIVIVSDGPFRFSRNPLYLSMALLTLGVALFYGIDWAIVTLIPAIVIVHFFIIRREERYLEGKFGDAYLGYKRSVRRWI